MNSPGNDFLLFLEEEHHQHLLEAGNLGRKPREIPWSDENAWTSRGYHAKVLRSVCRCGTHTDSLIGIFHEETTPSGKSRSQALNLRNFQVSLGENYPIRIETGPLMAICPACLSAKGFFLESSK